MYLIDFSAETMEIKQNSLKTYFLNINDKNFQFKLKKIYLIYQNLIIYFYNFISILK